MPFQPFEIPETFAAEGSGARDIIVPDGDYLLAIEKVVASPETVEAGKEFFSYRMVIEKGHPQGVGQRYSHLASFGEKAAWSHNLLVAAGMDPAQLRGAKITSYAVFAALAEKLSKVLAGKKVGVVMAEDTYNGKTRSRAAQFYPAAQFVERATPTTAPTNSNLEAEIGSLLDGSSL
jgi:hypothetical protein